MTITATEPATGAKPKMTYDEYIAAGIALWGYDEFAVAVGRRPQSLRTALMRRNEHIREDAARRGVPIEEGEADPDDIPAPACYKHKPPRAQPQWLPEVVQRFGRQAGMIDENGKPIPPRSGRKPNIPRQA